MAVLTFRRIIIDLTNNPIFPYPVQSETVSPAYSTLHFVNLGSADEPEFELHQGQQPAYKLSPEESSKLLRLMQNMTISAPQIPKLAFDGMVTELSIQQHGSGFSFRWHCDPPTEWDSISELDAFVTSFQK
jgi:hypothetical protein